MSRLRMNRHPGCYVMSLYLIVVAHAVFCYPAATCRGFPTIGPFWEVLAPYVMFLPVVLVPIFDDFEYAATIRRNVLLSFCVAMTCLFAVAQANLGSSRPHIGHLAGYWGVVWYDWPDVVAYTIQSLIVVVPFVVCLESVGRGFWSLIRRFPDSEVDSSQPA